MSVIAPNRTGVNPVSPIYALNTTKINELSISNKIKDKSIPEMIEPLPM